MSAKAFCVVGMARSGTSLVAGAVRQGGVYFGQEKDLMPPLDVINGEGFFEHMRIVDLHRRLLLQFLGQVGERVADGAVDPLRVAVERLERRGGRRESGVEPPRCRRHRRPVASAAAAPRAASPARAA